MQPPVDRHVAGGLGAAQLGQMLGYGGWPAAADSATIDRVHPADNAVAYRHVTTPPSWWLVVVATLAVVAPGCRVGAPETPEAELRARLAAVEQPERFRITYRAAGTRVLDCFLPNREFTVDVDRETRVVRVVGADGPEPTVAIRIGSTVYLHRSLFEPDAIAGEWLRLASDVSEPVRGAVERAIGTDLAGFLLVGGLPPGARETAVASLEVAEDVRRLEPEPAAGRALVGYELALDPERFEEVAAAPEDTAAPDTIRTGDRPVVQIWFDGEEIARLVVRREVSGATDPDAVAGGWITDYDELGSPLQVQPPGDVTDASAVDLSALHRAARGTCELDVGG